MILAQNLGKSYRNYRHPAYRLLAMLGRDGHFCHDFWALRHVNLYIEKGTTFGIIGHNGAGKSTILKLLSGITKPTEGSLNVNGTVASILELGTGFHRDFSGRNNVFLNCALQGYTRHETERLIPEIIDFSELEEFIDLPVRTYSTGMYLRLAFAVATAVDPDILIIDEALSVGDEHFRNKCLARMNEFKAEGKTIVFVSHDLATVRHFCSRVALMSQGSLITIGAPEDVLDHYLELVHQPKVAEQKNKPKSFGSPRWGSGEVRIESVELKNQDRKPISVIDTNEHVFVDVKYHVHSPVKGLVFGLQIFRTDGTYVHGSNHYWHDQSMLFDFEQADTTGQLTCEIPDFPLLPGEYYLTFCCYNQYEGFPQAVDHWERAITFTVSERMMAQHGIIALKTIWHQYPIEKNKQLTS